MCLTTLVFILAATLLLILPNTSSESDFGAAAPSSEPAPLADGRTLADMIDEGTDDLSESDISYTRNDDGSIAYHIWTADGFAIPNIAIYYMENGYYGDYLFPNSTDVFYLENNIEIDGNKFDYWDTDPYYGFTLFGTFDGKGHTISVVNFSDELFNGDSTSTPVIQNVNIEGDDFCLLEGSGTIQNVNLTGNKVQLVINGSGTIQNVKVTSSTIGDGRSISMIQGYNLNLSHVSFNIASCMGPVICLNSTPSTLNCYDVEINIGEFRATYIYASAYSSYLGVISDMFMGGALGGDTTINLDSCRINLVKVAENNGQYLFSSKNINVCNSYFNLNFGDNISQGSIFYFVGNFRCVESQFDIKAPTVTTMIFLDAVGDSSEEQMTIYDTAIICDNMQNLFRASDYPTYCTYYYSGLYFHDPQTGSTTILNPDFTSYKWCIDTHMNDALPQLRRFVSIGDFMEQCDMRAWAKEKSKT